ncbi:ATP-binding protein [Oceanidesulfovibrio marinus]|uniref:histidine kinase n=1 Tax=Oceanidesulfovibrio marinus TaxID=370038 RepID=A0A6P1ZEC0_9BACT|nr:ATP-binding protein [Oceanidesulfovibrio marinus]TVM32985.1 histidine kinase [Oceanidesulfovibrio marinus]
MRGGFSFRSRVLASFLLVVFLGVLVPSWYTHRVFVEGLKDNADLEIRRLFFLVRDGLGENAAGNEATRVFGWMENVARTLRVRLALYDDTGGLIFASSGDSVADTTSLTQFPKPATLPSAGTSHTPPDALNLGVKDRSTSVYFQGDAVFASGAWPGAGELPRGRLLLGMPHYESGGWLQNIESGMYISVAAALVLAALFSLFLVRWLWGCMGETIAVAEAIGSGNYMKRLGFFKSKEFDALARSINSMAQSIEHHIRTITEQKSQIQAVLDSMREGVMVIDNRGRIRSVNRALGGILNVTEECVGKKPLEVVLSPELQRACDQALAVEAKSGPEKSDAIRMQIEPVRDTVYDVTIVPMRRQEYQDAEGGLVVVFHDISELSRLERIRRDFVANVSHELRTPLTSVKGYAETLLLGVEQGTSKPEGQKSFLEIIIKHANHMAKTVNDLLSLTRLESGKKPFDVKPVDGAKAAAQALRECEHLVEGKGAHVELDLPDTQMVAADFDRLVQVFRNLIENAVKYGVKPEQCGGSHDGVCLAARIWSREDNDGMVVFGVEDQGPGIPAGDMERIFERFYRVDKHRTKGAGSSGLGLAICKHIVEKLGGRLWAESPTATGTGTCFMFTVPKAPAFSDTETVESRPESGPGLPEHTDLEQTS